MMPAWTRSRFLPIWIATALLFVVSAIVAPGTTSESSLQGMVPFAAILACAAAGQTLVIQQRGLGIADRKPGTLPDHTRGIRVGFLSHQSFLQFCRQRVCSGLPAHGGLNGLVLRRRQYSPFDAVSCPAGLIVQSVGVLRPRLIQGLDQDTAKQLNAFGFRSAGSLFLEPPFRHQP